MKHSHYHKEVSRYDTIDVYRVLVLWDVADPCLQHAIKKLLVAGGRGAGKTAEQDVQEAIDSLQRYLAMRAEDTFERCTQADVSGYRCILPGGHGGEHWFAPLLPTPDPQGGVPRPPGRTLCEARHPGSMVRCFSAAGHTGGHSSQTGSTLWGDDPAPL